MKIFDSHCDTISKIYKCCGGIDENNYHVDVKRMREFENSAQVFAVFVDKKEAIFSVFDTIMYLIERYFTEISKYSPKVMHCNNALDIAKNLEKKRVAAMLAIEGGEALEGNIKNVRGFYKLGVRIMTLTWNYDNELGCGIYGGTGGLTEFGKTVVREMNRLGMIIDVSHLNEAGFWDVIKISQAPVIASHSNAYACCDQPRNLTDEQISALVDMNGYIGLNLYSYFLNGSANADISDVWRHVEHFEKLGAGGILGLGCDFDGVDKLPQGISGVQDICKLQLNEDITFNNFYNYIWRFFGK